MALTPKLSVEATLSVSVGVPATFDAAGYGALTYTEVGQVDSIGNFGATFQSSDFTPLKTGLVQILLGSKKNGTVTVSMADIPDDAGQILFQAATTGGTQRDLHAIKIVDSHGYTEYFQAYIGKFEKQMGDANKVKMRSAELMINTEIVTDAP